MGNVIYLNVHNVDLSSGNWARVAIMSSLYQLIKFQIYCSTVNIDGSVGPPIASEVNRVGMI